MGRGIMKLELTQKETQALISASDGLLEDLKNLKATNQISVGWSIMFDDLVTGLEKAKAQYHNQLKKEAA
jgi:thiamine monophosphate kinase